MSLAKALAVSTKGLKLAPEVTKADRVSLCIALNIKPGVLVTDSRKNLAGNAKTLVIMVVRLVSEIGARAANKSSSCTL